MDIWFDDDRFCSSVFSSSNNRWVFFETVIHLAEVFIHTDFILDYIRYIGLIYTRDTWTNRVLNLGQ